MQAETAPEHGFLRGIPAWRLVQRNLLVYRHMWMQIFSGFFEPLFYLAAVGYGIGSLIGQIESPGGEALAYAAFVAPAMLATSCLNGAITDGFFNPFFKLHFQGTYDAILATPLRVKDIATGEVIWAQMRGSLYSAGFLLVMVALGLIISPWGLLALPAAIFVSAAYSAAALMLMTLAKGVDDFDKVMNLLVHPMFLFSTTFFPLNVYPEAVRIFVQLTPLYHGISLLRGLTTGVINWGLLVNIAYLGALAAVSIRVAVKNMEGRLVK